MNLSLTIRSEKRYESKGTGVFVRDSGGIRELQSLDEIRIYYPDFDPSQITQEYYEPTDIWQEEITHNLAYLASHIKVKSTTLYYYLWKPSEIGYDFLDSKYVEGIKEGLEGIRSYEGGNSDELKTLLDFTQSLYDCISKLTINYSDEFEIIAQR